MVRPTAQKITATEKIVCNLQFLRGEVVPCHTEPHGEAPGSVRRQRAKEDVSERFIVISIGRDR